MLTLPAGALLELQIVGSRTLAGFSKKIKPIGL
jgi:hypothetical protein